MIYAGTICGVQNGLQSAMDLLKFVLVVSLPNANTFGILIILSFLVIWFNIYIFWICLFSLWPQGVFSSLSTAIKGGTTKSKKTSKTETKRWKIIMKLPSFKLFVSNIYWGFAPTFIWCVPTYSQIQLFKNLNVFYGHFMYDK